MAEVRILGAAGCVTGSCSLLRWGETRILVDCGLYQGSEELELRNWNPFEFSPHELSAVVVTHAHLDHTGLLPRLVREGYSGPVYCTKASRGLVSLVLEDAGKIQEEDARYARKKGYSRHADPQPLYTGKDARRVLKLLSPQNFERELDIAPGIRLRFTRAGHLLGAASVRISAKGSDGKRRSWCFSGDVGRYEMPILKEPDPPAGAINALVLESTYGDRGHAETDTARELERVIDETFARGGSVIIPAFALGRTQEVLYHLSGLADAGKLDPADVFLDSPMAITATDLYKRSKAEHDDELAELIESGSDPLADDRFARCRTSEQSRRLNTRSEPAVIVASSGMATGGRVVHHLLHRLGDQRNSVVFVGYQAAGTRGSALVAGAETVAIHGRQVQARAEIHYLRGLSAHADCKELLRWVDSLEGAPRRLFLNHGEDPARKALAAALTGKGFASPILPLPGDTFPW